VKLLHSLYKPFYIRCLFTMLYKVYILSPHECFINILGTVQLRIHKFAFLNSTKSNALSSLWYCGNKSKLTCAFVFILVDDSRPCLYHREFSSVFIRSFYLSPILSLEDYNRATILLWHSLFANIYR